ncbi:hypothetical protein NQ317_017974 [Molorchus minor]|uniref:Uncharacterized protein n=1 Tax=Molorchus minor TaxID=1323400 RepID=A0ABQ9JLM7_9CUCU|nr:hypothetical protein NQ317_017974 [Molorchus minor]
MLLELEKIFKPIGDCFDWLAGTSTEVTFIGSRPYSSEALENILKETFGVDTVMSDIKYPRVMVIRKTRLIGAN